MGKLHNDKFLKNKEWIKSKGGVNIFIEDCTYEIFGIHMGCSL